ncbi:MAG: metallophosphoesterase family protein [Nocardiopsaceae bacterium]|nr:metallophosphoesterase family protein [Nocardiopsaceae bacterium]
MRITVLSDTHAPRRWKSCPPAVAEHLRGADLILHAGDVCTAGVLDELSQYAPVTAVLGNNDGPDVAAWGAPGTASLEAGGLRIAMIHDSGPSAGRLGRMRRRFPDADLVVFGHSHIPLDESSPDGAFRIFNPGSPTDRRRQPHGTIGLLEIAHSTLHSATIIPVT